VYRHTQTNLIYVNVLWNANTTQTQRSAHVFAAWLYRFYTWKTHNYHTAKPFLCVLCEKGIHSKPPQFIKTHILLWQTISIFWEQIKLVPLFNLPRVKNNLSTHKILYRGKSACDKKLVSQEACIFEWRALTTKEKLNGSKHKKLCYYHCFKGRCEECWRLAHMINWPFHRLLRIFCPSLLSFLESFSLLRACDLSLLPSTPSFSLYFRVSILYLFISFSASHSHVSSLIASHVSQALWTWGHVLNPLARFCVFTLTTRIASTRFTSSSSSIIYPIRWADSSSLSFSLPLLLARSLSLARARSIRVSFSYFWSSLSLTFSTLAFLSFTPLLFLSLGASIHCADRTAFHTNVITFTCSLPFRTHTPIILPSSILQTRQSTLFVFLW